MNPFWEVADFVRGLRREMRFGELSRAPLRLLRLELSGQNVACDWVARPADVWDGSLRQHQRERNVSGQALRDAIAVRDLLFDSLPGIETALLRAFRASGAREPPELVIVGSATREAPPVFRVTSLAMRAKLSGFQFEMDDGILQPLEAQENGSFELMNDIHFRETTPSGEGGVLIYGGK
jgi:hypothetical protein